MKRITRRQGLIAALYLASLIILLTTNPQSLPLIVLLIPLTLFFVAFFLTIRGLLIRGLKKRSDKLTTRQLTGLSAMIAGLPYLCILLQSVGQLSLRDFLLLVIFFGILWFYVRRSQVFT